MKEQRKIPACENVILEFLKRSFGGGFLPYPIMWHILLASQLETNRAGLMVRPIVEIIVKTIDNV